MLGNFFSIKLLSCYGIEFNFHTTLICDAEIEDLLEIMDIRRMTAIIINVYTTIVKDDLYWHNKEIDWLKIVINKFEIFIAVNLEFQYLG